MKAVGGINRNGQRLVMKTTVKGTSGRAYAWLMRCNACSHEYYANSTEAFQRKCPNCQKGRVGIPEAKIQNQQAR